MTTVYENVVYIFCMKKYVKFKKMEKSTSMKSRLTSLAVSEWIRASGCTIKPPFNATVALFIPNTVPPFNITSASFNRVSYGRFTLAPYIIIFVFKIILVHICILLYDGILIHFNLGFLIFSNSNICTFSRSLNEMIFFMIILYGFFLWMIAVFSSLFCYLSHYNLLIPKLMSVCNSPTIFEKK